LARIDRADVGAKQHRQPFYFKFWFRCDQPDCSTRLVMPIENSAAIAWNVEPFPLRKDWRRDQRDRPHRDQRTLVRTNVAPSALGRVIPPQFTGVTRQREGPPPDPADSSCPFDLA
jgi:hypothetical protein